VAKVDFVVPAPDGQPPELVGGHARGQGQHNVLVSREPAEDGDVVVEVLEVLPGVRVRQHHVLFGGPALRLGPRLPGQEEGVRSLAVVVKVLDEELVL